MTSNCFMHSLGAYLDNVHFHGDQLGFHLEGGIVSEPYPWKNRKEGQGDRLGWNCTVCPEYRHTLSWFMIACQHAIINCNPVVQLKEMENSGICWQEKLLEDSLALIGPTDD